MHNISIKSDLFNDFSLNIPLSNNNKSQGGFRLL